MSQPPHEEPVQNLTHQHEQQQILLPITPNPDTGTTGSGRGQMHENEADELGSSHGTQFIHSPAGPNQ